MARIMEISRLRPGKKTFIVTLVVGCDAVYIVSHA